MSALPFFSAVRVTVTDESAEIVHCRVTVPLPGAAVTWLTVGGVASYLSETESEAVFPARSLHVPVNDTLSFAGPS